MDRCVSPAGTSLPTLLSFFFHVCGDGRWFSPPPHSYPCPDSPPSPSLPQEAKEGGEGWGGQGSPSVLRLHRVFRLNQEIFYYQKEKRKKKFPSGHLSSLPHWDSRDWICGVSREGGSGLEHSQARVVEFPVRPSARPTLGFSPLLSSFPSKQTTRGGLPLTSGPWAGGLGGWGLGQGCWQRPGAGRLGAGLGLPPHCILCPSFPRLGISFHKLLWGRSFPSSKSLCHLLPPPPRWKAGLTPGLGEGRGLQGRWAPQPGSRPGC